MTFLVTTDFRGLVLQPRARVAMVREEYAGRLEVLSADGTLTHRPGPLEALQGPPFVQVGEGILVNRHLALPQGWRVERPPVTPAPPAADPVLPGGVRASEVLYADGGGRGAAAFWMTHRGPVPGPGADGAGALAALHPDLRRLNRARSVNPLRLRALHRVVGQPVCRLVFDEGTELETTTSTALNLARRLGADHYDWVGGETDVQCELRVLGVRRWPFALQDAPAEFLASEFPQQPARLLANLAVQTWEAHQRGERVPDGHRAWHYQVARRAVERAGHMKPAAGAPPRVWSYVRGRGPRPGHYKTLGVEPPLDGDSLWLLVCRLWTFLVGELRLFTYREAGFRDRKPEARRLGRLHPGTVVLCEKTALQDRAFTLHERLGVTVYVSGGVPPLQGTERLSEELRDRGVEEVDLLSYCDFDPVGWDMPVVLKDQLARYGLGVRSLRRLVTPDRFTADEIGRLSVPLPEAAAPHWKARVRRFVRESGGVHGRARGLLADFLPQDRLLAAAEESL